MFACRSCFRRAIRSLFPEVSDFRPSRPRTSNPRSIFNPDQSRSHSTVQAIRKGHHRKVLRAALNTEKPKALKSNSRRRRGPLPGEVRDVLARENNRKHLAIEGRSTSSSTEFQLQWLQDPLKLANAVMDRLRIGADESALDLIRGSERTTLVDGEKAKGTLDNVVSWNHVMEYYMHKGDTREALKVYNEMKKRGHRPSAQTYTIMLKGFSTNIKKPNAVQHAVSVYNSIFAPNSLVKPNTIHTNALINVCARGGDMPNLWAVAGKLPDRGPGAADNITYTNILNAIRADAEKRSQALSAKDEKLAEKVIIEAVRDGERLWIDVNKRWRAGDIFIDEALTCAMGRLLLLGREAHHNHVFSLVEQTMRIPTYENSLHVDSTDELQHQQTKEETLDGTPSTELANFEPIKKTSRNSTLPMSTHAKPFKNTLSMLLQACRSTRNLQAGKYYWNLLTSKDGQFKISYDVENFTQYLRLLRVSRSSKVARDLLTEAVETNRSDEFFTTGIFVIAMSTCVRDKNNPNVCDYASDIFEIMQSHLHHIDAKVMEMYLELALVTTPGFGFKQGSFDPDPSTNTAMRALARIENFVPEVKEIIMSQVREEKYEDLSNKRRKKLRDPREAPDHVTQHPENLSSFMTSLIGAYDRLISQPSLSQELKDQYMNSKRRTHTFAAKMDLARPAGRTRRGSSFEREDRSSELDSPVEEVDAQAGGRRANFRPRTYSEPRDRQRDEQYSGRYSRPAARRPSFNHAPADRNRGSYQEGMGSDFAILAKQQGRGNGNDFVQLGN